MISSPNATGRTIRSAQVIGVQCSNVTRKTTYNFNVTTFTCETHKSPLLFNLSYYRQQYLLSIEISYFVLSSIFGRLSRQARGNQSMFYDVRPGHQWSIVDSSSHISVSFVGGMIIVHRSSNTLTGYTITGYVMCHSSLWRTIPLCRRVSCVC